MRTTTLNIRTSNETKHLFQEVAAMLGTTVSGFLLSSATEKAYQLIQNKNHFLLNDDDWDKLCNKLDQDPARNLKLQKLLHSKGVFKDA